MTNRLFLLLSVLCVFSVISLKAQTPAFPGAEGGGMYATGGRGGYVYYVTTLEDDKDIGNATTREGSFRWCINQNVPRTIIFKVSGTIMLKERLNIRNGNLTIAGQTAPGDGICIGNNFVDVDADNVIIRYLRFRMGDDAVGDGGADAFGGRFFKNIIVDHCSVSWSTDECASFYNCDYFTMQWCIISESLRLSNHDKGPHGYGGIWGGTNATFHHNLMAHHDSRCPRFGPGQDIPPHIETVDHRNNVIYNHGNTYGGEGMNINMVNNYYKPGPKSMTGTNRGRIMSFDMDRKPESVRYNVWGRLYVNGNVVDDGTNNINCSRATEDNWTYGVYNQFASAYTSGQFLVTPAQKEAMRMSEPFKIYGVVGTGTEKVETTVTTHDARTAYEYVLEYSGASLHRDSHDERIVMETRTGTTTFKGLSPYNGYTDNYPGMPDVDWRSRNYPQPGIIDSHWNIKPAGAGDDWTPWPVLAGGEAPQYTAGGVPAGWLDTNYPGKTATDRNEEGYTYLEVYLNSLISKAPNNVGNIEIPENRLKLNYDKKTGILFVKSAQTISMLSIYSITGKVIYSIKSNASDFIVPFISNSEKTVIIKALTTDGQEITEKLMV